MALLRAGAHALQALPGLVGASRALVLTYGHAAADAELVAVLGRLGAEVVPLSTPLLTVAQVGELAGPRVDGSPPEVIVAVGGGAVMDAAKCLRLLLATGAPSEELLTAATRPWRHPLRMIAVPTTAGTGSEATCFATVYEGETKHSVEHAALRPEAVLLDPCLLRSVPRATAIASAFDALAQGMEAVWSVRSTPSSVRAGLAAVHTLAGCMEAAIATRELNALARLQRGAYLAGAAIQRSRTTLAHALSYPLSARHGVPHGLAVFLNLARVIRYNAGMTAATCADPRGLEHHRYQLGRLCAIAGVPDPAGLARWVEAWFDTFQVSATREAYGLTPSELAWVVDTALASTRSGNNPRLADREALLALG